MTYFITQMADWKGISALRIRKNESSRQLYLTACSEFSDREADVMILSHDVKIVVVGPDTFTLDVTLLPDKVRFRPITKGFVDWAGTMSLDHSYEMVEVDVNGERWLLPFLDPDEPSWDDDCGFKNPFRD